MRTNNIAAVAAQYRRKAERDGGKRRGADAFKPVQRDRRSGTGGGNGRIQNCGAVRVGRLPAWMDRYWIDEPDIPRITAKKEHRVDRLRALGNAVYWRQFYPILRGIMEIETKWNTY